MRPLVWFAVGAVLVACGGHDLHATGGDVGEGVGGVPIGGASGSGGTRTDGIGGTRDAGTSNSGGAADGTGGVTSQGDSADMDQDGEAIDSAVVESVDSSCDVRGLWDAITRSAGVLGACEIFTDGRDPDPGFRFIGQVVLDTDGRVTDNTGLNGASKQSWLDGLASDRWLCLAGRTLTYYCVSSS